MKFLDRPTKKFSSRFNAEIDTIVIHNTDGNLRSALYTLTEGPRQVSAHLLICRLGNTYKIVDFDKNAWHAGNSAVNRRSIGIELEAWKETRGMTPVQEKALKEAIEFLCKQYKIKSIIPHRHVRATECPGWIWPTTELFRDYFSRNFGHLLHTGQPRLLTELQTETQKTAHLS